MRQFVRKRPISGLVHCWAARLCATTSKGSGDAHRSIFILDDLPEYLQKEFDMDENRKVLNHLLKQQVQLRFLGDVNHAVTDGSLARWIVSVPRLKKRFLVLVVAMGAVHVANRVSTRNADHLNCVLQSVTQISSTSTIPVWWSCPVCCKSWKERPRDRVKRFELLRNNCANAEVSVCIECERNIYVKNSDHAATTTKKPAEVLADCEHLLLEARLRPHQDPHQLSLFSGTLLQWCCRYCEHEFTASIRNRYLHSERCPQCSGKEPTAYNLVSVQRPEIMLEVSARVPRELFRHLTITDTQELSFVCRTCFTVYSMSVASRCQVPRDGTACPKCLLLLSEIASTPQGSNAATPCGGLSRRAINRQLHASRKMGKQLGILSFLYVFSTGRMGEVLPVHLALFFSEQAFLRHHSLYSCSCFRDELGLWLMHRAAQYYALSSKDIPFGNSTTGGVKTDFVYPVGLEDGGALLLDFLAKCYELGGSSFFESFRKSLVEFLMSLFDGKGNTVSLHMFGDLFVSACRHLETGKLADNSFSRFRNWFYFSWRAIDFETQLQLMNHIPQWLNIITSLDASGIAGLVSVKAGFGAVKNSINVRDLHESLQVIFEGKNCSFKTLSEQLINPEKHSQVNRQNITALLDFFNENNARKAVSDATSGSPQSVMTNIACGMLLYEKTYLQLRSLENALTCAEGAVLIEHQFYTTTIIALAHLSCFDVHLASTNARQAADYIAMGLQLIRQKRDSIDGSTVSLFYISGSHLLLLFPGAVGSFLRTLLYSNPSAVDQTSIHHGTSDAGESVGRKGGSMAIQTVPQTVLRALLLSELQSIRHSTPTTLAKEISLYVLRQTMLVKSSLYGMPTTPLALGTLGLYTLLEEVIRTAPSMFNPLSSSFALHPDLCRLAAHSALATQEGTIDTEQSPLRQIADFLWGVRDIWGSDVMSKIEADFFLRGVTHHLIASWLAQHGFITAAYDMLGELISEIYFQSRVETLCPEHNQKDMRKDYTDCAAAAYVRGSSRLLYWPPDHLLLYSYAQMKKAELASYLGFIDEIKHQKDAMKLICSRAHFAFGVLASKYVGALYYHRTDRYSLAIEHAASLESSARKIGFSSLSQRVAAVRVSAYMKCGNYKSALLTLDGLQPLPKSMSNWFFASRLGCMAALCTQSPGGTPKVITTVLHDVLRTLNATSSLLNSYEEILDPSSSVALVDAVATHASLTSLYLKTLSDSGGHRIPIKLSSHKLLAALQKRHLLRGVFPISQSLLGAVLDALKGTVSICSFFISLPPSLSCISFVHSSLAHYFFQNNNRSHMEQEDFKTVAQRSLEFTRRYYKMLDDPSSRQDIVQCYAPDVPNLCEWNGHRYATREEVNTYIQGLPKTAHKLDCVDAQPLPGTAGVSPNHRSFLITVHGVVTYSDEHKREFFQRFVIIQRDTLCHIVNDYYRWLSEKISANKSYKKNKLIVLSLQSGNGMSNSCLLKQPGLVERRRTYVFEVTSHVAPDPVLIFGLPFFSLTNVIMNAEVRGAITESSPISDSSHIKAAASKAFLENHYRDLLRGTKTGAPRAVGPRERELTAKDFNLIRCIGRGAFGEIFICSKHGDPTKQIYALKRLKKSDMLKREQVINVRSEKDVLAEAAARNPWIVTLHASFQDDEYLYMLMEYMPGGDMITVHEMFFVHRDIKPDNILFGLDGHIKLSDFGLSKRFGRGKDELLELENEKMDYSKMDSAHLSNPDGDEDDIRHHRQRVLFKSVVGSPSYIAPEIVMEQPYGLSCDWWSVGVIMFEMLFGYPPFYSHDMRRTVEKIKRWREYLRFPSDRDVPQCAIDLIKRFLCDPSERLSDYNQIKAHPFFHGIDFDHLRECEAIFKPTLSDPLDTRYFPPVDPNPQKSDDRAIREVDPRGVLFADFQFNSSHKKT
eukprot:gene10850-7516_t